MKREMVFFANNNFFFFFIIVFIVYFIFIMITIKLYSFTILRKKFIFSFYLFFSDYGEISNSSQIKHISGMLDRWDDNNSSLLISILLIFSFVLF